jgi:hypothetical protein
MGDPLTREDVQDIVRQVVATVSPTGLDARAVMVERHLEASQRVRSLRSSLAIAETDLEERANLIKEYDAAVKQYVEQMQRSRAPRRPPNQAGAGWGVQDAQGKAGTPPEEGA